MRNPAITIDPEVEAAIEATRQILESYVQSRMWKADPDSRAIDLRNALSEIERSPLPERVKLHVRGPLVEAMKKRRGKPTLHFRDCGITTAAIPLIERGYSPTRNDATRHKESASSIVCEALRRLNKPMKEKQINPIVLKYAVLF